MADIVTENDLTLEELPKFERFKKWRQEKADKELPLAFAALNLSRYVNGKTLAELHKEFADVKSPKYIELFKVQKPVLKIMLFAKLSIEDYCLSINEKDSNDEKLVTDLQNRMGDFYDDYNSNLDARIDSFSTLYSKWLDSCPNTPEAEKLCLVFYTLLKITSIRINNMRIGTSTITSFLIDLESCKNNVRELLEKSARKLQSLANPNDKPAPQADDPLYKAVYDYLNLESRHISKDGQAQVNTLMIDSNLIKLGVIQKTLTETLKFRKEIAAYATEQTEINALLADYEKRSFSELIQTHEKIWVKLFNMSNSTVQGDWKEKIVDLNSQSTMKSIISGTQSVLSAITFGSVSTTDKNNKSALKKMAEDRLLALKPHLSIAKKHLGTLTTGNEDLNQHIEKTDSEALEKFTGECDSVILVMNQYRELARKILAQREVLEHIRGAHQSIDEFLNTYQDFFVLLSNFFAHIWSIFKTEKALLVDQVLELREETMAFEKGYDNALKSNLSKFQNNLSIPSMAKEVLIKSGLFEDTMPPTVPAEKVKTIEKSKLQEFFFSIKASHTKLNQRVSNDSKDSALFMGN